MLAYRRALRGLWQDEDSGRRGAAYDAAVPPADFLFVA